MLQSIMSPIAGSATGRIVQRLARWAAHASLAIVAVAVWGMKLHAQAQDCTTFIPACPPAPPLKVSFTNSDALFMSLPVTLYFSVTGIGALSDTSAAQVTTTVNGQPVGSVSYQWDGNHYSLSGEVVLSALDTGTHTVTLKYSDSGDSASATTSVTYSPPTPPPARAAPIVTQEPNSMYRRSITACDGCLYGAVAYSTPTYRSLDQDRGVTLVYSSVADTATAMVVLDVNVNSTVLPKAISVQLVRTDSNAVVPLTDVGSAVYYRPQHALNRIAAHFDASAFPAGALRLNAVVTNIWENELLVTSIPVTVLIVRDPANEWGRGWSLAGREFISNPSFGADAVIADGSGQMVLFRNCGWGCWQAPAGDPSGLYYTGNGTYERRFPDGSMIAFEGNRGRVVERRDRFGNRTTYEYHPDWRLWRITDPAGLATTITWTDNSDGSRAGIITLPGGRQTRVEIDPGGRLSRIVDPQGVQAMGLTYSNGRLATITDRVGGIRSYTYDRFGGLATIADPSVTLQSGAAVRPTTVVVSRELALLPRMGYAATVDAPETVRDTAWVSVIAPNADSTFFLVNGEGNVTHVKKRDPNGVLQTTTVAYNEAGQPVMVTGTDGTRLTYGWSGANLGSVTSQGTTTSYSYNTLGQLLTTAVNGVQIQRHFYSGDGRSVLERSIAGEDTTIQTYDPRGRVLTVRDPEGHHTSFVYQTSGFQNLQSSTRSGKTMTYGYDSHGRPSSVTNPANQTTTTEYDELDRVTRVITPGAQTSVWTYDDAARMYTFSDPKGGRYATYTDGGGRVTRREDPHWQNSYVYYDAAGRVAGWRDRDGLEGAIRYDALGRDSVVKAGLDSTVIAYGPSGRWVSYSNAEGSDTLHYDGQGRQVRQVTVRGGRVFTATDVFAPQGHRHELTITAPHWAGTPRVKFDVDELLRPSYLVDFATRGTSITYNKDHLPYVTTLQTGTTPATRFRKTTTYTSAHSTWQESYSHWNGILNRLYGYDALNRVSEIQRGAFTGDSYTARVASYDVMGRLESYRDEQRWNEPVWVCNGPEINGDCNWEPNWQASVERQESYMYDAVGNRTDSGASLLGNRMTAFAGYAMGYDGEGNMLSKVGNGVSAGYSWNALGQLVSVGRNGVTTTFGYDGLGRRVRKTVNGVTKYYLHDGDNLVMQLNANGDPELEFSYYPGIDQPHAVRRSSDGAVFYYVTERPGHVTALVNTNNQIVNQYAYTPFGEAITVSEQVPQPFRFTGREYDSETGLYYFRARYYDPVLARFISEDPIGLAGGVNPYVYVGNDPVNHRDPTGLAADCFPIYGWVARTSIEERPGMTAGIRVTSSWEIVGNSCIDLGQGTVSSPTSFGFGSAGAPGLSAPIQSSMPRPIPAGFGTPWCRYNAGKAIMSASQETAALVSAGAVMASLKVVQRTFPAFARIYIEQLFGVDATGLVAARNYWGLQAGRVAAEGWTAARVGEEYGVGDFLLGFVPLRGFGDVNAALSACGLGA